MHKKTFMCQVSQLPMRKMMGSFSDNKQKLHDSFYGYTPSDSVGFLIQKDECGSHLQ